MDTATPSPGQVVDLAPHEQIVHTPRQQAPLCADCKHCVIEAQPRHISRMCSRVELRHVVDGSAMDCYHARFHPYHCGPGGRYFQAGTPVETTVNALQLMAAAPALKLALEGLVRAANLSDLNGPSMAVVADLHIELRAADQALNQAEGRA